MKYLGGKMKKKHWRPFTQKEMTILMVISLACLVLWAALKNHHAMDYKWVPVTIQNSTVWTEIHKRNQGCEQMDFLMYMYKKSGQSYVVHNGETIKIPVPICLR